jgi:hypothetical protein
MGGGDLPGITRRAAEERAKIFFADKAGYRNDHQPAAVCAPVGETPVVKLTAKRESVGMISAISRPGAMGWMLSRVRLTRRASSSSLGADPGCQGQDISARRQRQLLQILTEVKAWLERRDNRIGRMGLERRQERQRGAHRSGLPRPAHRNTDESSAHAPQYAGADPVVLLGPAPCLHPAPTLKPDNLRNLISD